MRDGYRYSGTPGKADYNRVSFQHLSLIISTTPKLIDPVSHRRTIPTAQLIGSSNPQHQAELMAYFLDRQRLLLACLLCRFPISIRAAAIPYNILIAIGLFWFTKRADLSAQCCEDGKIHFWIGLLPCIIMFVIAVVLLRVRSMPSQPFWRRLPKSDIERRKMNLISRYIIRQMAVMAVYALLAFLALSAF